MAGRLRTVAALAAAAAMTPALVAVHLFAGRTGLIAPTRIPNLWYRIAARLLSLKVVAVGAQSADRPLLIVANHVSWLDIVVLGAVTRARFVAKGDMNDWPLIGRLSRLTETIFVDRGDRRGSAGQAKEIADKLAAGESIILFAEGTTGDGQRLLPFKSSLIGAVERARREAGVEVAIQPVAIAYTRHHGVKMGRAHRMRAAWIGEEELVPHLRDLFRRDVFDVEVHFGEPFGLAGLDRKAATRKAETAIRDRLTEALRGGS